jgi:catechol 2,3-dioxygenase-like lactoylglutathione lyase family enzyme
MGAQKERSEEKESEAELDWVHHLAIEVDDVGAAVAWYAGRFRCRVAYGDASWALLEFENLSVALVTRGDHPPHFGVCRRDAAAFGEIRTHRDGVRYVYVTDPSGNTVEVVEEKDQ